MKNKTIYIVDGEFEGTIEDLRHRFHIETSEDCRIFHDVFNFCKDRMHKLERREGDAIVVMHEPERKESVVYIGMSYGDCRENCEYDQDWECNLIASLDLKKVQQYLCEQASKLRQYNHDLEVLQGAQNRWREANPKPNSPDMLLIPKWKTGIRMDEITPEMRAERDAIKAQNEIIREQSRAIDKEYQEREDAEAQRVLNKLNIPETEHERYMGFVFRKNFKYKIETIPYV